MAKTEEADRGVEAEDVDDMPPAAPAGTGDHSRGTLRRRSVGAKQQQINTKSEQIFVKNLEGKTLTLDVDLLGTIDDVMAIVKEKDRLPNSEVLKTEFFFMFEKKVVDNGKPLSKFGIRKGSTLTLTTRVRGGRDSRNSQLDTIDLEGVISSNKESPSNTRAWHCRTREIGREWLNNAFSLVVYGDYTTGSGLDGAKGKKCLSTYSIKALLFSITMLSSYLTNPTSTSSSCTNQDILFMIAFLFFIITDAILLVVLPKKYSNALVCISWFLLEMVSCLLSNLFNGYIALAILAVPLPTIIVVAIAHQLLQHKVEKHLLSFNNNGNPQGTIDNANPQDTLKDQENQHFDHLFDLSQGIANCGGLITAVISDDHNYVVGFFFFFTIALALYLMMVITVRAVACPHATCLAIVLIFSFLITIIAAFISFVHRSGSHPQLEIKDLSGPF